MGRTGFGVEFSQADFGAPLSPYGQMLEQLGDDIDEISVSTVRIGVEQGRQLRAIEETRIHAIEMALELPGSESRRSRMALAERSVVSQVAASLRLSEFAARKLIWTARCLVNDVPLTLEHLSDGAISLRHAQILVGHMVGLDADSVRQLEAAVLNRGMQQTPPQFARSVRVMVERLSRATGVERQAETAENRITYVEPMRDGMGRYVSEAPIVQVIAVNNCVTDVAKWIQADGETRTLTQLKTDLACDLLLNVHGVETTTAGRGNGPLNRMRSIRPKVLVAVPAMTLLRRGPRVDANGAELTQEPGILESYGPISPQTAREIAANAESMIRILTHPGTGVTLYTTTSPTCAPDTTPGRAPPPGIRCRIHKAPATSRGSARPATSCTPGRNTEPSPTRRSVSRTSWLTKRLQRALHGPCPAKVTATDIL